jgi:hypothetical protein
VQHNVFDASHRLFSWCDAKMAIRERLCHVGAVGMPLPALELHRASMPEPPPDQPPVEGERT